MIYNNRFGLQLKALYHLENWSYVHISLEENFHVEENRLARNFCENVDPDFP